MSWAAIVQALVGIVGLFRDFFHWKEQEDARQSGKDNIAAKVNKESADAQDRMAQVDSHPSDDDVSRSMSAGKF